MKNDDKTSNSSKFHITSSYQGFTDRHKNVFDQLNIAEHNTKNLLQRDKPMETDDPPDIIETADTETSRTRMKHLRGQESIFKKPLSRPPRIMPQNRVPDYRKNPHKWTRYSLDDVRSEDMSDKSNTAAAMSFLNEIKSRKSDEQPNTEAATTSDRITFKKANKKEAKVTSPVKAFKNSKLIMPEYVVGQRIAKEIKRRDKGSTSKMGKEIKLDHLLDEDEEGED